MVAAGLAVGLGLLAASALAHGPLRPAPSNQVNVESSQGGLELAWSDYEERLRGIITPNPPIAGQPLLVSIHVGSFEGDAFEGPVTLTLRKEGSTLGQTQTVRRGEVNWTAEFTPESAGPHQLTVTFHTSRLKMVHAKFQVTPSPVPRVILWSFLGLITVGAVAFGVRSLLREERPDPAPHPEDAPLPEPATDAPVNAPSPEPAADAPVADAPSEPAQEAEKKPDP